MSDTVNPASDPSKTAEQRLAALAKQQKKSNAEQAGSAAETEGILEKRHERLAKLLKQRQG